MTSGLDTPDSFMYNAQDGGRILQTNNDNELPTNDKATELRRGKHKFDTQKPLKKHQNSRHLKGYMKVYMR